MNLTQKIRQVSHWLRNTEAPVQYDGAPALLMIDVQKPYARPGMRYARGNKETKAASQKIAKLVPQFRKLGVPIFAVYFSDPFTLRIYKDYGVYMDDPKFYKYQPVKSDIVVAKTTDGAFDSGKLHELLQQHGIKTLLTCGFNASACVYETVRGGIEKGYQVTVLEDITENGVGFATSPKQRALERMLEKGAAVTSTDEALQNLRTTHSALKNQRMT